ncbi:MAG: NAD(P)/FAD-dependent oxidoreductase [Blastocatellia bacterium]
MSSDKAKIVVLGSGAAGTAIAYELATRCGANPSQVVLLYREKNEGSSFTNQKWKHSGLFYSSERIARGIWDAYETMTIEHNYAQDIDKGAYFIASHSESLCDRSCKWGSWGIPYDNLEEERLADHFRTLGRPHEMAGGFVTKDFVIDFPRMIHEMRQELSDRGMEVRAETNVEALLVDQEQLTGIRANCRGQTDEIECAHCIVALGAWTPALLRTIGIELDVLLLKSCVLTYGTELVDRTTVWIDAPGITFVPFRGKTLIADGRYKVVKEADQLDPFQEYIEELQEDLANTFPNYHCWKETYEGAHGCIKTGMKHPSDKRDIVVARTRIFAEREITVNGWKQPGHGVRGVTAAIPGKASLSFTLAKQVAEVLAKYNPVLELTLNGV